MNMRLSNRMEGVIAMVTLHNSVCDVGCDHGFVSIALVERGISPKALAMDVNEGPLCRADKHISEAGLEHKITTRLSDGLKEYEKGEAQTLIIAGMGGPLIQDILSFDKEKSRSFSELILSPQSEIPEFRMFLSESGYEIKDEEMILEDGKFYVIIKAVPGERVMLTEDQLAFGPVLLEKRHPVLKEFLDNEANKKQTVLCKLLSTETTDAVDLRIEEIKRELDLIGEVRKNFFS